MAHHNNLFNLFRSLNTLFPVQPQNKYVKVGDDAMFPTLKKGQSVDVDSKKPVLHGDIVAISREDGIDFREVYVCKGTYYLVAHNQSYPKIAMSDYLGFNPDSHILGIVCKLSLRNYSLMQL